MPDFFLSSNLQLSHESEKLYPKAATRCSKNQGMVS